MKHLLPLFGFLLLTSGCSQGQPKKKWTIMHYAVGSNSSEMDLMSDIEEMKQGKQSYGYNFICLIDRIAGFSEDSTTLDGNFTDTRLYEISQNAYTRLDGKQYFPQLKVDTSAEINMGDAETLRRFIQYTKTYYPAENYLLVLRSHGNGVGMCPDAEGGERDRLYPAEISRVLTNNESVDILGLDVCSMAGVENLYEWRPNKSRFSADYVIASAPLSGAWAYDAILRRLSDQETDSTANPDTLESRAFSELIFEEIQQNQQWASWGLFDNSHILDVKAAMDEACKSLVTENRDSLLTIIENTLGYHHNTHANLEVAQLTFPYIDAYHFWQGISTHQALSSKAHEAAKDVCLTLDALVMSSYYGRGYLPETVNFISGKSGVYQITPRGNQTYSATKRSFWNHTSWYHPNDQSNNENAFGQYGWCKDGAISGNQSVDNFFEFLDFLFDESNDSSGGVNGYQW